MNLVPTSTELQALADKANGFIENSKSPATLAAYRSDLRQFGLWCDRHGITPLPCSAETLVAYLSDQAGTLSVATLARRLTSLSIAHRTAGHPNPTRSEAVKAVWAGIRRTYGTAHAQKRALETADVVAICHGLGDSLGDHRDRCLLLLAFTGALRRSELVALNVEDIEETAEGLVVTIRRSKTDRFGEGAQVGVPFSSDPLCCPVRAYAKWLEVSGITSGAVFRHVDRGGNLRGADDRKVTDPHEARRISPDAANLRVKRMAKSIGLDDAEVGAHSLRRGFATSAAKAKATERDIMRHGRWKSVLIMRSYIEAAGLFDENAAAKVVP
jgi:site-specific recombinase XerD